MIEYRVWCESGDLIMVTSDQAEAFAEVNRLREQCAELNFCDDSSCGVLSEHGYFIQEVDE